MGFWSRAGQGFTRGFSSTFDVGRELRVQREMRRQKAKQEKDRINQLTLDRLQNPYVNTSRVGTGILPEEELELYEKINAEKRQTSIQNIISEVNLYTQTDADGNPRSDRIDPNRSKAIEALIAKEINNLTALRKTYTPRMDVTQEVTPARMGRISTPSGPSTMPDIDEFGNVQIRDTADEASVDYQLERSPGFLVEDTTIQKSDALLQVEDALNTLNTLAQRVTDFNESIYKRGKARTGFDAFLATPTNTEASFNNFMNSVVAAQTNYRFVDDGLVEGITIKNLENAASRIYAEQGLEAAEAFLDRNKKRVPDGQSDIIRSRLLGMYDFREDKESEAFAESVLKSNIIKLSNTNIDNSQALIHMTTISNSSLSNDEKKSLYDIVTQANENNIRTQQENYNQLLRRAVLDIQTRQERDYKEELKIFQRNNQLAGMDVRDENMQRVERPEYVPNMLQIKKTAEDNLLQLFPEFQVLKDREAYGRASVIAGTGNIVDGAISLYASRVQSGSVSMDENSPNYYENVISADASLTLAEQRKVTTEIGKIDPVLLREEQENYRSNYDRVQSYIPENDDYLNKLTGNALLSLTEVAYNFKKSFRENQELTTQDIAEVAHEYATKKMNETGQSAQSISNFIVNYVTDRPAREMFVTTGPTQNVQAEPEEQRTPSAISAPDSTSAVAPNPLTENSLFPPKRYGGGGPKKLIRDVQDVGRSIGDMFSSEEDNRLISQYLRENYNINRWSPRTRNAVLQQVGMTYSQLLNAAKNARQ